MSLQKDMSPDVSVPALLFQVSQYAFQHGSLGAARSLGRLGVPTYLFAGSRFMPHALSRYVKGVYCFDDPSYLPEHVTVARLLAVSSKIGRPAVLIPTDDEAAVLIARNSDELRTGFLIPQIAHTLPEELASKRGLAAACSQHGVPTPRTFYAETGKQALEFAASTVFPVVVKNSEPWHRITSPAVPSTVVVSSFPALALLSGKWPREPRVIIQEYIPPDQSEDWIVHVYCDGSSKALSAFSGRKLRSWPPGAGVTTLARVQMNHTLLGLAKSFCAAVKYKGIADMDWRLDRRDGKFKLVDFNPRLGANFGLFSCENGVDVVRALYLDLSAQKVPLSPVDEDRAFCVENLDFVSRLVRPDKTTLLDEERPLVVEYAWFAWDDLLPFVAMILGFSMQIARRLLRKSLQRLWPDPHGGPGATRQEESIEYIQASRND